MGLGPGHGFGPRRPGASRGLPLPRRYQTQVNLLRMLDKLSKKCRGTCSEPNCDSEQARLARRDRKRLGPEVVGALSAKIGLSRCPNTTGRYDRCGELPCFGFAFARFALRTLLCEVVQTTFSKVPPSL